MEKPYHPVVLSLLRRHGARVALDAPCGTGWLGRALARGQVALDALDGLGLWEFPPADLPYREVREHDLDTPLPQDLAGRYDAAVCGEAIHLVTNPGLLLAGFRRALGRGGLLVITTPNTWYLRSRWQYLVRGFHSGFSPMVGKRRGEYVTYLPWSFPQLHLFLTHAGFRDVALHEVDEPKPKRAIERLLAVPGALYCRGKRRAAGSGEEAAYWRQAGCPQSLYGRWLVVSARA